MNDADGNDENPTLAMSTTTNTSDEARGVGWKSKEGRTSFANELHGISTAEGAAAAVNAEETACDTISESQPHQQQPGAVAVPGIGRRTPIDDDNNSTHSDHNRNTNSSSGLPAGMDDDYNADPTASSTTAVPVLLTAQLVESQSAMVDFDQRETQEEEIQNLSEKVGQLEDLASSMRGHPKNTVLLLVFVAVLLAVVVSLAVGLGVGLSSSNAAGSSSSTAPPVVQAPPNSLPLNETDSSVQCDWYQAAVDQGTCLAISGAAESMKACSECVKNVENSIATSDDLGNCYNLHRTACNGVKECSSICTPGGVCQPEYIVLIHCMSEIATFASKGICPIFCTQCDIYQAVFDHGICLASSGAPESMTGCSDCVKNAGNFIATSVDLSDCNELQTAVCNGVKECRSLCTPGRVCQSSYETGAQCLEEIVLFASKGLCTVSCSSDGENVTSTP